VSLDQPSFDFVMLLPTTNNESTLTSKWMWRNDIEDQSHGYPFFTPSHHIFISLVQNSSSSSSFSNCSYTMETPTRFKKELFYPYSSNGGSSVNVDQLNNLLINIGYHDSCLSSQEQTELLRNAGETNGREISLKKILELID
jgi:hypothetical protein